MYDILFPMVFFVARARRGTRPQRMTARALASRKCCLPSFGTGRSGDTPPSSLSPTHCSRVESLPPPHSHMVPGLMVLSCLVTQEEGTGLPSKKWGGCLRSSPALCLPADLSCLLDFLPMFTEGDGVDLNGWNLVVLSMARG